MQGELWSSDYCLGSSLDECDTCSLERCFSADLIIIKCGVKRRVLCLRKITAYVWQYARAFLPGLRMRTISTL
jgi:hypothetical protein